jgi:3-hydroxyisobutyrate dehydrogenase-like beta-hydroxyacid dehydrogenase
MLVSGEGATRYAAVLAGFGAQVTVQPGPAGEAISRKLLRSVFYKGLAAAVIEALAAAEAAGCGQWLRGNIGAELAGFDERTIDRLVDGTHRHARRRVDEMTAAVDQLLELGVPPRIAAAARDLLERAERIADDHGREAVAQVQVQTETGAVFLVADERRLAVATTGAGATAGLVFYDLKSLLREIAGGPAADAVGAGGA